MDMNEKLSEALAVLGAINPTSQAAGSVTSGWVSMSDLRRILALIQVGTFGVSATVDANVQQAQDSSGTGAKPIGSGKAIVQMLAAGGNNVQALINVQAEELDVNNGFDYVELTITVGVAATETAGVIIGGSARYSPSSAFNAVSVVQTIA